ncbi:MAG TPA: AfsR/SARP family transcriptional regulator [Pilimelia sp.]|nr:AfsR/SARP family transcriptional regulator [Pilimelia sp.]
MSDYDLLSTDQSDQWDASRGWEATGSARTVDTSVPHDGRVRFRLLGPLEVVKDGRDHAPTAPKVAQLLAMLLLRPGRLVTTEAIIQELWTATPPRSARSTVQTYVYQLRRCIDQNGLAPDAEAMLATRSSGYTMRVDPDQIDVFEFQRRCRVGRVALTQRRYAEAAQLFNSALSLWSDAPLATVSCGAVLTGYAVDLEEQRRNTQHLRIEAEIAGGLHRELVGELRSMVSSNPLDEGLHGQLMRVLAHSGRRLEAMATYRQLRNRLAADLGVEPCGDLQVLHHELLSAGEPTRPR